MKVTCKDCGKTANGTVDQLIEKGWHHTHGNLNGKKFSGYWCGECFVPGKVLELLGVKEND
jgi:hypothetical protein